MSAECFMSSPADHVVLNRVSRGAEILLVYDSWWTDSTRLTTTMFGGGFGCQGAGILVVGHRRRMDSARLTTTILEGRLG